MKFRENAWEFSTSCTWTFVPPKKNASNYVYFFLTRWKYITVFKSKYIIIFDFSEFKRKANTCEFHKKGRTSIPSLFYSAHDACLVDSFFIFLFFFFWTLCCLSFLDSRILIVTLVSTNSSSGRLKERRL